MKYQDLARSVGRAIATRRQSLGLTQERLATQLDVDRETISRFERGTMLPTLGRLNELAEVLEVPLAVLVQETSSAAPDQANEIVQLLSRLAAPDREWVKKMLTELCERLAK